MLEDEVLSLNMVLKYVRS